MPVFPVITTGIAGFVTLIWVTIFIAVPHIENDLTQRVGQALGNSDLQWVEISARGQNVTLAGYVPSFDAQTLAVDSASQVWGVGDIINETVVVGTKSTCQNEIDEMLSRERIQFEPGKYTIHESSRFLLKMLAAVALNCHSTIEISGHTDSYGNPIENQRVSEARAKSVRRYLISSGVPRNRLAAIGYGETKPLYDNRTEDGRRHNRRIEFRVLGSQSS